MHVHIECNNIYILIYNKVIVCMTGLHVVDPYIASLNTNTHSLHTTNKQQTLNKINNYITSLHTTNKVY